jgi:hypothetical protein
MIKILEIIEVRSVKKNKHNILDFIDKLLSDQITDRNVAIKIYSHSTSETDYSIHLYYEKDSDENLGAKLGYTLTEDLKEFGLVSHNIWIDKITGEKNEK